MSTGNIFYLVLMAFIIIALIREEIDMAKREEEYRHKRDEAEARFLRALAENERIEQEIYRHARQKKVFKQQQVEIEAKAKAIPKQKHKTLPKI